MTSFEVLVIGVEISARVHGTGHAGSERSVLVLGERNMLAGSIRGVVGGMTVVGGHGMPEGAPLLSDASRLSALLIMCRGRHWMVATYPDAIAAVGEGGGRYTC